MLIRRALLTFVAITYLVFTATKTRGATFYSITDIGPATGITGLNDSGQVAGLGPSGSFLYDGAYHAIPNPTGGTFYAAALNNNGQVVGEISFPGFSYAIGLYSGGTVQVLGLGSNVSGSAINNAGLIAGDLIYQYQAMTYANGTITPIGVLPGDGESTTRGLNQAGDVLVYSAGSIGHAGIYLGGALRAVTGSAGLDVQPEGINNLDQVVGSYSTANRALPVEAILFSGGQAIPLGALAGTGTEESFADAINDSGIIVGSTMFTAQSRATVFDPDLGPVDLNSLLVNGSGWTLQSARRVNDAGQIAGIGMYQGIESGFLLDPVPTPEPLSAGFTALGVALLVVLYCRRRASAGSRE